MHRFKLIGRLLAAFAIAGLLASPAVTTAVAKLLPAVEMTDASMADASITDASMADMPCCPDTQKSDDCQDCPLGARCAVGVVQIEPPSATGIPEPLPTRSSFLAFDDMVADSLDGSPPDHPPRLLV
jgi:hypothetical protein